MGRIRLFAVATMSLLSACGDGGSSAPPPPSGSGVRLPDVSKAGPVDGRKVDAAVIRGRSVAGRWTGRLGDASAGVTLGSSSASFELLRADGALVASGSGPFSWSADGTVTGSLSSPSGALAPFARWSASFPSPGTMAIAGADGASLKVSRPSYRPSERTPVPAGWGR